MIFHLLLCSSLVSYVVVSASPFNSNIEFEDFKGERKVGLGGLSMNGKYGFPSSEEDDHINGEDGFSDHLDVTSMDGKYGFPSSEDVVDVDEKYVNPNNKSSSYLGSLARPVNLRDDDVRRGPKYFPGNRPAPRDSYGIPPSSQNSFNANFNRTKFVNYDQIDNNSNAYVIKDDYPSSTKSKLSTFKNGFDVAKKQFKNFGSVFGFVKKLL